MRRILIALGIIIALVIGWVAIKDTLYSNWLGSSDIQPAAPDYSLDTSWFQRPAEAPPGGWDTPWGVDVFVLAPPAVSPAPKGMMAADDASLIEDYDTFADALGLKASDLVVYAPGYRSPSPSLGASRWTNGLATSAGDVGASAARYVAQDNRERALIIVAAPQTEPLLTSVLDILPDDEAFRRRFGGVVLPADMLAEDWSEQIGDCSPAFETCAVSSDLTANEPARRLFLPSLRRSQLVFSASEDFAKTIEDRASALSQWLDREAPKPAEPFDSWAADEVIDVKPIRRPNSDRDISGERGN